MNNSSFNHYGFFIIILITFSSTLFGQGSIVGVVTDSLEKFPLIGTNIVLEGTAHGAATDQDGYFIIPQVLAGTYKLTVSYISYKSITLTIKVVDKQTTKVNISLILDAIQGETVVVTAQALGQAAAINKQLTSNTITNVVSSEKIMELPTANAAESVGRLPGISIKRSGGEGNKVVIRGLSPTYNAITIAGDRIPATDLDDRSVDLSMIAPEMLAGIEVTKALTPDKDADALGGTVDFSLATAARDGFKFNARMQRGYNNQRDDFGNYKGRFVLSDRFNNEKLGLLVTGNTEKTNRSSDQWNANYSVVREKREDEIFAPITTDAVTFEHSIDVRHRFGFNVMMDYLIPSGKILFNNFLSRLDRDEIIRTKRYGMSGSNKTSYYLEDQNRQIDILTSSLGGEHEWSFLKFNWKLSRSASTTRYPSNSTFNFEEVGAFDVANIPQFAAPEDLLNNAYNNVDATYLRKGQFEPERSYERDLTAQFNYEWPFRIVSDIVGKFKGGAKFRGKSRERDRDYANERLDDNNPLFEQNHSKYGQPGFEYEKMTGTDYPKIINYLDPNFDAGTFLDGEYDFGVGLDATELRYFLDSYLLDNFYRFSLQRDLDDYEIKDNLKAGYILTELNFGRFLMFMPGIRFEASRIDATGRSGVANSEWDEETLDDERIQKITSVIKYRNWFPMIHLRLKPTRWFDIRLAYTESVSYPRLDYIIPAKRIKSAEKLVVYGNPALTPQLATNYDVYFSLYKNRVGLFTLGGFYKEIDNLIYLRSGHMILDPEKEGVESNLKGYSITRPENNFNKTKIHGFEAEWQTNFNWLPRPFNGIVISANYSHIWSETNFPRSFVVRETIPVFPFLLTTVIDTFRTGKMPDQAADIANIALGYDIGRFSGRISMLMQGKTLSFLGAREELDGYTDNYIRWDLSVNYDLSNYVEIFCNLNNITNRPDQSFMQTARYPTARDYYGWTTDFGIAFKF